MSNIWICGMDEATTLRGDFKISEEDLSLWIVKFNDKDQMFKEEPQDLRENLNVYVMHGSSIAKNLNVSTGGGLSVDFDSLVDMSSL